jgi:hypothetical protein
MALAPTFRQRAQWQVPKNDGFSESSNFTAPQQQLPGIFIAFSILFSSLFKSEHNMNICSVATEVLAVAVALGYFFAGRDSPLERDERAHAIIGQPLP